MCSGLHHQLEEQFISCEYYPSNQVIHVLATLHKKGSSWRIIFIITDRVNLRGGISLQQKEKGYRSTTITTSNTDVRVRTTCGKKWKIHNVQGVPTSSEVVLTPCSSLRSLRQCAMHKNWWSLFVYYNSFGILQQFCSNSNSSRHVRPPKSNICLDFSRGRGQTICCCYYYCAAWYSFMIEK